MKKSKIINPASNWTFWGKAEKEALKSGTENFSVGDHIVFENDEFRVWSIHLAPGHQLPFHKHTYRYFWSALSSGTSRSWYSDGSVSETHYESGDTVYFEKLSEENYFIHNLENTGDTQLIFLTVEFKN
ncbi:hypothetical protein CLU96_0173 [Chryseobacterium sp. 52]|uniref:cupin domain-containing protein n=1 Tax=Chryseobacterium sp. 52 TaxID=2035213 RepID=UPI000C195AAB|nr:cupin domain-containing protein [Chryseobacterium sp. 52]PIF43269.1 hypothetical protein CLU96_0173 [Chryseobacterium sp. 52]